MASPRLSEERRHILRRLRDDGFEYDGSTGSHEHWRKWNPKKLVVVPTHREVRGDTLRSIYKQAGWDWKDSLTLNLPKEKGIAVTFSAASAPARPISSCATPTADSRPPIPLRQPEPEKVTEVKPAKKVGGRAARRDALTVELIAQDFLENPNHSISRFQNTWSMSGASLYNIRAGRHGKLKPRTIQMLDVVFRNVSPAGMTDLLKDYRKDPDSIPALVRKAIEKALPTQKISGHLPPAPVEKPAQALEKIEKPAPVEAPKVPVTPVKEIALQDLRDILEVAREAMRRLGVTKVVLPERGQIVVHRKEYL